MLNLIEGLLAHDIHWHRGDCKTNMMTNPANMAKNGTLLFCKCHDRFSVVFIHTLYATVLNTDREMTNITMIITILLTNVCSEGAFVRGFLFAL